MQRSSKRSGKTKGKSRNKSAHKTRGKSRSTPSKSKATHNSPSTPPGDRQAGATQAAAAHHANASSESASRGADDAAAVKDSGGTGLGIGGSSALFSQDLRHLVSAKRAATAKPRAASTHAKVAVGDYSRQNSTHRAPINLATHNLVGARADHAAPVRQSADRFFLPAMVGVTLAIGTWLTLTTGFGEDGAVVVDDVSEAVVNAAASASPIREAHAAIPAIAPATSSESASAPSNVNQQIVDLFDEADRLEKQQLDAHQPKIMTASAFEIIPDLPDAVLESVQSISPTERVEHMLASAQALFGVSQDISDSGSIPAIGGPDHDAIDNDVDGATAHVVPELNIEAPVVETGPSDSSRWQVVTITKGDTLSTIFSRFGFEAAEAIKLVKNDTAKPLKRLVPGRKLHLMASDYGTFGALKYEISVARRIEVQPTDDGFRVVQIEREPELRQREVTGVITSSLSEAATNIGLNQNVIMQMVSIFAYQIDFALDLRSGDRFSVIFEEQFIGDTKVGDGEIVAAEFVNDGHSHRAIRHIDEDSRSQYYTPEGRSMKRAFLRTPVQYSRVSSGFSKRRYHPVLKKWRAHKGVDYAARRGTPIVATGDGKISFAGKKGGYGKMVEIKHGNQYRTRYAHMSRFKKGMRRGAVVKQGDVIGYVGRTGYATGDHLHYEFHVNGKHRDPLKVKLPRSMQIASQHRNSFLDDALIMGSRLDALNANVASREDAPASDDNTRS